nr:hypothetical protein [uncultured Psychroserpens sp.]
MKRALHLFLGLFISASILSCENTTDIKEKATAAIMKLHNDQRKFHFEKMPEAFASLMSKDHISVNRGLIKSPSKAENIVRFQNYFNLVEFEEWDDITPPIIKFSEDYSMAYTVVNKRVTLTYTDEQNNKQKETTEFSWVAIYKNYPDKGWKIDCVASTNLPSVSEDLN